MNMEKIKEYFNKYFVETIKTRYTDFKGRASRAQYWYFVLFYIIISIPFSIIDRGILHAQILTIVLSLALLLPSIAVGVRRLHDLGKPGWWYLMVIVPIVGPIALLILFCMPGEYKTNAFGPKPE